MGHDLHLPVDGVPIAAAAVVLHPHPGMGGDRQHPLVVSLCTALADRGVAALRPDLTDPIVAASADVLEDLAEGLLVETGVERLVLVGYSWGAAVSALAEPAGLERRVLVAPPLGMMDVTVTGDEPLLVLVPAHDQYGPPDAVEAALGDRPGTAIEVVEGCDHFLTGAVARITTRAVEWLV
jgi:alpha/beta superfamily hydrolase